MPRTRLYADAESRVLWLSRGRAELALSRDGVWLRGRRGEADVVWDHLDQIQVVAAGLGRSHIDVFTGSAVHRVGAFPERDASAWVAACAAAAEDAGYTYLTLRGAEGFAMGPKR
jgi:hypothetical protein